VKSFEERFWEKVRKTGSNSCWQWLAGKDHFGYGRIRVENINRVASSLSWEMHKGKIPKGSCVLHSCDNPECTNPKHLFLGTRADNVSDMMSKKRHRSLPGESNPNRKLTLKIVQKIRKEYSSRLFFQKDLAKKYEVSQAQISWITSNKGWVF